MSDRATAFDLDRAIGFFVNRTAYVMSEEVARRFGLLGFKLTAQDFGILFRLWKQDGLTQMQIAALMMRDKTTITRRLDGLVKKGLIERCADPHDRRHCRISLTEAGRQATERLMEVVDSFQKELLADVPQVDREATVRTLKSITEHILRIER